MLVYMRVWQWMLPPVLFDNFEHASNPVFIKRYDQPQKKIIKKYIHSFIITKYQILVKLIMFLQNNVYITYVL
jgi:hypothetical protein